MNELCIAFEIEWQTGKRRIKKVKHARAFDLLRLFGPPPPPLEVLDLRPCGVKNAVGARRGCPVVYTRARIARADIVDFYGARRVHHVVPPRARVTAWGGRFAGGTAPAARRGTSPKIGRGGGLRLRTRSIVRYGPEARRTVAAMVPARRRLGPRAPLSLPPVRGGDASGSRLGGGGVSTACTEYDKACPFGWNGQVPKASFNF